MTINEIITNKMTPSDFTDEQIIDLKYGIENFSAYAACIPAEEGIWWSDNRQGFVDRLEAALNHITNSVAEAVAGFFGGAEVVYATPGTGNHTANFYGDEYICALTANEVCRLIECAAEGWLFDDGADSYAAATDAVLDAVLDDLQHDRPEEN